MLFSALHTVTAAVSGEILLEVESSAQSNAGAARLLQTTRFSPLQVAVGICALVFVGETFLMVALTQCLPLPPLQEGIVDATLLLVTLVPPLYAYLIRPLEQQIRHGQELTQQLLVARDQLEERVRERSEQLSVSNDNLHKSLLGLERTHAEQSLLREMGELLQACRATQEAEEMLRGYATRLFPSEAGAVYVYRSSRNVLELAVDWGEGTACAPWFPPEDCWALRRGRFHLASKKDQGPACPHLNGLAADSTICIPMMAHGEATGLLLLVAPHSASKTGFSDRDQALAEAAAEQIALALANLKLREKLRDQAIRDPLTGLFNRRYFEESLDREIHRAERRGLTVGLVMIDVDHFKKFNDTYGHEGGDAVLRDVGRLVRTSVRGEDVGCRYGGEEFVLMLTETSLDSLCERTEELRKAISSEQTVFRGQLLKSVTISCGVAIFPQHGSSPEELLRAADAALYVAKERGRDRLVVAAEMPGVPVQ